MYMILMKNLFGDCHTPVDANQDSRKINGEKIYNMKN